MARKLLLLLLAGVAVLGIVYGITAPRKHDRSTGVVLGRNDRGQCLLNVMNVGSRESMWCDCPPEVKVGDGFCIEYHNHK